MPDEVKAKDRYLDDRAEELTGFFQKLLPHEMRTRTHPSACKNVVVEAAELAKNIRLSVASCWFVFEFPAKDPPNGRILFSADLEDYIVINLATGQPIRGVQTIIAGPDGRVGEVLCCIHPALKRKGGKNGKDIVVAKATILVKFDYAPAKRGTRKAKESSASVKEEETSNHVGREPGRA